VKGVDLDILWQTMVTAIHVGIADSRGIKLKIFTENEALKLKYH
jgi:hypothetical protein